MTEGIINGALKNAVSSSFHSSQLLNYQIKQFKQMYFLHCPIYVIQYQLLLRTHTHVYTDKQSSINTGYHHTSYTFDQAQITLKTHKYESMWGWRLGLLLAVISPHCSSVIYDYNKLPAIYNCLNHWLEG